MSRYEELGFFDFEDFVEELNEEELFSVNGGACGAGSSYNPTPHYGGSCAGGGAVTPSYPSSCGGGYTPPSTPPACGGGMPPYTPPKSDDKNQTKDNSPLAKVKYGWAWCLGMEYSDSNYITDDYGNTIDRNELAENLDVSKFHHGIDLKASKGDRINSMMNGKVTEIGYSKELGNYIVIKFDGSRESIRYAHCDTITASTGQTVVAGQKVATVGNTGVVTGYHLHVSYDGDGDGNFNSGSFEDNPAHILFPGSM